MFTSGTAENRHTSRLLRIDDLQHFDQGLCGELLCLRRGVRIAKASRLTVAADRVEGFGGLKSPKHDVTKYRKTNNEKTLKTYGEE